MARARRFSRRLVYWTTLSVSLALILASITISPPQSSSKTSVFIPQRRNEQPNNGKARKVNPAPPVPGAPAANLPGLEETRQRLQVAPQARQPIPSTMRSRRKPIESRQGRKVGDRLPPQKLRSYSRASGAGQLEMASAGVAEKDRRAAQAHHARRALSPKVSLATPPQGGNAQNVIWINAAGVSVSGNNLTKTAGDGTMGVDGWGNAGASSAQRIMAGDGYVEFTASETNTSRICGLSHSDPNQHFLTLEFGLYLASDGNLYVLESGSQYGPFAAYAIGDLLRVSVESGTIKYKKNGIVLYTSTVTPAYPLLVDTSLWHHGSTLTNVVVGLDNGGGNFSEQYIQNFIYWALLRQPTTDEVNYWEDIFRAAYAHQQGSMMIAVREMGRTMFESAEYSSRNRSDHEYVYDLYKTYLMRGPEPCPDPLICGWTFWTNEVAAKGRAQVRRAFDECGEFANRVAAMTSNGSPSSQVSSLLTARVDPNNQPGNQLLARDAEWGVQLLSLPGRGGLDLGLGLSYSSAVWTRSGPYTYFDEDNGTPSPGFRLGFPTVQEVFFDAQVGVNARMLITPSGSRVELRQVGTSNVYEAADSSYLQLIDSGGSLLVRSTDGTRMSYAKFQDEWRCTQIEDRNGNLIIINNDDRGIISITDTLGREITFNYDGNANLISITQNWGGQTHTWATFGWGNIPLQPDLPKVVGTHGNEVIPVLTQVGLADGSLYTFEYNANGHVNLIHRYLLDSVQRSYIGYDYELDADSSPRLTGQRVWAQNWTGNNDVPNEVVTYFNDPGDGSHVMTTPDGTIYKEFYGGTGVSPVWQKGLVVRTEVFAGAQQKVTTTSWIKDNNTPDTFQTNPRVSETNIYDSAGNRRRTTVEYNQGYGLPTHVREYGGPESQTLLRLTTTVYKSDSVYINRRIIGLPAERTVVEEPTGKVMSRQAFYYDWGAPYFSEQTPATNHDSTNYPSWSIVGRGNLVGVLRYNCENNTTAYDDNQASWLQLNSYNVAGSLVWTQDGAAHRTNLSYADSFSDLNNGRGTLAYPTTVTDADGYASTVEYNFDFGAQTRVQGPPPANQSTGVIQTYTYDNAVRLQQVTTVNNGAYTRYVYGPNYLQQFTSVNNIADDAYAVKFFDGAGRVIAAASYHPGSSGGYKAQLIEYDRMGRIMRQSNPTEINGNNWVPAGDDAAGWFYTQQTYDWKGRPLVTTNQDGWQKYASYSACGCAGSEIVTLTDEVGRQQKVYGDVFGRTAKTEVLNDNGGVYSTTANIYNTRDQVTAVNTYNGSATSDLSCPSGTCMQSLTTYDGYGRVATQRLPQQTAPATYAYNTDDTVQSVTDPRGVIAINSYNNRHLLTGVSYTPASGIEPLAAVSFGYDAVGNRTSMSDGTGSIGYVYDSLSRITSETRTFTGLSNQYAISYGYNLAGELTNVTDPSGAQVSYNYDSVGRLSNMPGSGYNGVTNFLSNAQYRASGAMKHATYGNSVQVDLAYNSRMQIGQYQVSGFQSPFGTMGATMSYYDDGRTNTAYDLNDSRFDRKYEFDFAARLKEAYTGPEAHGAPAPPIPQAISPYRQSYTYDAWNNVTLRSGRIWSVSQDLETASYGSDNKRQGWGYDAAGNATWTGYGDGARTYDAAGHQPSLQGRRGKSIPIGRAAIQMHRLWRHRTRSTGRGK